MSANDLDLLRAFTRDQSQDAFAILVQRHLNLVYCALRQVRSPQLNESRSDLIHANSTPARFNRLAFQPWDDHELCATPRPVCA
jgi:hypothetical protein